MKIFLGIDYGQKRIGLAMAHAPLAEPYKIIDAKDAVIQIQRICQQEKITDVVVGMSENQTAEKTQEFIQQLKAEVDVPIHIQDETLSSYEVKEMFLKAGKKKAKIHGHIDHFAASIILQNYLDENS